MNDTPSSPSSDGLFLRFFRKPESITPETSTTTMPASQWSNHSADNYTQEDFVRGGCCGKMNLPVGTNQHKIPPPQTYTYVDSIHGQIVDNYCRFCQKPAQTDGNRSNDDLCDSNEQAVPQVPYMQRINKDKYLGIETNMRPNIMRNEDCDGNPRYWIHFVSSEFPPHNNGPKCRGQPSPDGNCPCQLNKHQVDFPRSTHAKNFPCPPSSTGFDYHSRMEPSSPECRECQETLSQCNCGLEPPRVCLKKREPAPINPELYRQTKELFLEAERKRISNAEQMLHGKVKWLNLDPPRPRKCSNIYCMCKRDRFDRRNV